jgi:hypothetical protein
MCAETVAGERGGTAVLGKLRRHFTRKKKR